MQEHHSEVQYVSRTKINTQPTITRSKLATETPEQGVKYVQN